jgi:hypothetical protein
MKDLEESDHGTIEILPQHLPGGTRKNMKSPSQDSLYFGWDSNRTRPEYKFRTLPLYHPIRLWTDVKVCCELITVAQLKRSLSFVIEVVPLMFFFSFLFAPILEHRADFSLSCSFTDCRTPWTDDQLVARSLPKHRTTQTQKKKHTHTHIKHPCPEWDSNLWFRPPSERRQYMP